MSSPATPGIIPFASELAKYFMDFLETDFHKIQSPKRKIQTRNSKNLQVCISLNKYKKFSPKAWKFIRDGFQVEPSFEIKKTEFTTTISKSLLDLIKSKISLLTQSDIDSLLQKFQTEIEVSLAKNKKNIPEATLASIDGITRILRESFIDQFVESLREPLEKHQTTSIDSIYQIEEELTVILLSSIEENVSAIINHILLETEYDEHSYLSNIFELDDLKNKLESYFSSFSSGDLFYEIAELFNNKALLENQEFYLYFCDISLKGTSFPLFYIPIAIEKTAAGFQISFDSLVYVHKKAVQFVIQNFNAEKEKNSNLRGFLDRIIHLSDQKVHFATLVDEGLKNLSTYFGLEPFIDIKNAEPQSSKSRTIGISNSCYIAIADKSDESLVNDYEEILDRLGQGDNTLASGFQVLVDDFITNNPLSVVSAVETDWDRLNVEERLVYESPVPLNEEQKLILSSLSKPDCKYISVQGPPGTGKSHTITAIVCDAVLNNKSVLVLSDKKEALDVVEDKITQTLNKVRTDKNFQNPILRLGQAGNTYSKILSNTSMIAIKEHYKVTRNEFGRIEETIDRAVDSLKKNIKDTVTAYSAIKIENISEVETLKKKLESSIDHIISIDISSDVFELLNSVRDKLQLLENNLSSENDGLKNTFRHFYAKDTSVDAFQHFLSVIKTTKELSKSRTDASNASLNFDLLDEQKIKDINSYVSSCLALKSDWFGYLFSGNQIKVLNDSFQRQVPNKLVKPHKGVSTLTKVVDLFDDAVSQTKKSEIQLGINPNIDSVTVHHSIMKHSFDLPEVDVIIEISDAVKSVKEFIRTNSDLASAFGISNSDVSTFIGSKLRAIDPDVFSDLRRYIHLRTSIETHFDEVPDQNYLNATSTIESLVTAKMTHKLDERVVDFYENSKNDAKTLATVISQKKKFDRDSFAKLKQSFPCILAGIRDFAEFIPLQADIFDIVIIDEASQVSIAQALPALLRGKKIVVLGDKKQFSNVKSTQARSDTNARYLNRLREVFVSVISTETVKLERLEKFNIKTSVLEFSDRISNYECMLKKHFRGYREIISYSSKHFYDNALQAIKIRSKPVSDVIKFEFVEHDGKIETTKNTNSIEVLAIVAEVERLSEVEPESSIAIITPHTNQQKVLVDAFSKHKNYEAFQKSQRLKIMTFDTCQGEERDIVLYSMVANPASDKLWGVFIKDLQSQDLEEDGKIKAQRLNVGFSRAKERIHFFLSKPIEEFTGSIGQALTHFQRILEDSTKLPDVGSTDPRSPMEAKVLEWIQETPFFKEHHTAIELHTQFPLGEYLKQLNPRYEHPKYVVDFLLIYLDEESKSHKVIIEYDGFEFHFESRDEINEFNWGEYHTEQHVYREKVLESYGYNFVRLNRFNLGEDPIESINNQFEKLLKKKTKPHLN
jgi:hypothetical protein